MAKFGLDWVKFKTQPAVLFKTEVSISPALQEAMRSLISVITCHIALSLWYQSRATKHELQQLTLPQHSVHHAQLTLVTTTSLGKCSFTVRPSLKVI